MPRTKKDYKELKRVLNTVELYFGTIRLDYDDEGKPVVWFIDDESADSEPSSPYYLKQNDQGEWKLKEDG